MTDAPKSQVIALPEQISAVMAAIPLLPDLLQGLKNTGRSKAGDGEMVERLQAVVRTLGLVRDNEAEFRELLNKKRKK
jgi:hypothetical protein